MKGEVKNVGYLDRLEPAEVVGFLVFFLIILLYSNYKKNKNRVLHPEYQYYTLGLMAKLLGAGAFCWVYTYYYKGGDTIAYYESGRAFGNLLLHDPSRFFKAYFSAGTPENFYLFNSKTGYPWEYMYYDPKTLMVIKLVTPFVFLSANSYLLSSLMLAWASYSGLWRLYRLFCTYYPELRFQFLISLLLLPSAVFWGSGMLKDTITLSASCWFIYSFYYVFILKQKRLKYSVFLVASFFLISMIKPYIIFALLPGAIVWNFNEKISSIKNALLRSVMIPVIFVGSLSAGYFLLTLITGFEIEELLQEAAIKQTDLKREEYQGNSFDIGTYEPTVQGALAISGPAMIAGLYRPYAWEARNVVMIFSGIENIILLALTLNILWGSLGIGVIRLLSRHPLVLFCISFSVLFSLIVGLSTSNFGALVRFKIAFLPMFASGLVVLNYYSGKKGRRREKLKLINQA